MSTAELVRALAVLAEPPVAETTHVATALRLATPRPDAYTHVFALQLYPYASVYLGPEGMLGGEARDRIAGFYRALGSRPVPECDHVAALLAAYADTIDGEHGATGTRAAMWRRARTTLLHEHLLSWLPAFADSVRTLDVEPYPAWAEVVEDTLRDEMDVVGPPGAPAAHFNDVPAVEDPRLGDSDAFLGGLLAPARSGVIVTGTTLSTAAAELGLGVRVGERRFVLRALLAQDAAAVLTWLSTEAQRAAQRADDAAWAGPSSGVWSARARTTGRLLTELASDARVVLAGEPAL